MTPKMSPSEGMPDGAWASIRVPHDLESDGSDNSARCRRTRRVRSVLPVRRKPESFAHPLAPRANETLVGVKVIECRAGELGQPRIVQHLLERVGRDLGEGNARRRGALVAELEDRVEEVVDRTLDELVGHVAFLR